MDSRKRILVYDLAAKLRFSLPFKCKNLPESDSERLNCKRHPLTEYCPFVRSGLDSVIVVTERSCERYKLIVRMARAHETDSYLSDAIRKARARRPLLFWIRPRLL
jgi:hypothetical protein